MEGIFTFHLTIGIHLAGYLKNMVTEWFFKLGVSLMLNSPLLLLMSHDHWNLPPARSEELVYIQSSLVNVEIGEQD
jgi:hypothetical protein